MTFALGSGISAVAKYSVRGRVALSASLTSYVTTMCANADFSTLAAKKRPGLTYVQSVIFHGRWKQGERKTIPRMSTMSKGQILGRRRDELIVHTLTF